jgi:hypothetical protein
MAGNERAAIRFCARDLSPVTRHAIARTAQMAMEPQKIGFT